jgi:hypothetical protein
MPEDAPAAKASDACRHALCSSRPPIMPAEFNGSPGMFCMSVIRNTLEADLLSNIPLVLQEPRGSWSRMR